MVAPLRLQFCGVLYPICAKDEAKLTINLSTDSAYIREQKDEPQEVELGRTTRER